MCHQPRPDIDDDDNKGVVMIKPACNYRVDEDREPIYYTMIHHIDDLRNLIDNVLVYR